MTKTQIWVSFFLVMFIALFLLARLTKMDTEAPRTSNPVPQKNMDSEESSVMELIDRNGCKSCHGPDLNGSATAPALVKLSEFWSRDKLVNYLRNPSSFMDSDRFKAFKEKYPGTIMPPFNNVDVRDLGKIADYLLTR